MREGKNMIIILAGSASILNYYLIDCKVLWKEKISYDCNDRIWNSSGARQDIKQSWVEVLNQHIREL